MNEKKNRPQPKKILLYAILLAAFLVVTNPTLLPFLSPEAKQSIGSVWRSLFGDVDSIASVLVLNWATLFKLVAMVLLGGIKRIGSVSEKLVRPSFSSTLRSSG